ncbi:BTAD domain-containing putative transcriptional regulator [Sphingobium yanoikuyae]|uniref:AfsR/SARP family transcriptional regulator n=1 Tax=Sphingobium yanoikuyae TaxID=13690 RepID=UPI0028B2042E|nr:BTAD domain-containing putative transcriptional regulator [Sphingobium yanoikuyae]
MTASTRLRIRLFGDLSLTSRGEAVGLATSAAPIIGYLIVHRDRAVPRGELAGALWPERSDMRARRCLSTALWRIKSHAAMHELIDCSHHEMLRVNWRAARWVDTVMFERRASTILRTAPEMLDEVQYRQLRAAVALYRSDLMRSSDQEWAMIERQRLRHLHLDALFHLAHAAEARGDMQGAIGFGRQLSALEPLREDAHRLLMRIYVSSGNRAKAIEQYRICQGELSTELNVDPTAETQALFATIIGDAQPSVAAPEDRRAASLDALSARVRYARRAIAAADLRLVDALTLVQRAQRVADPF